MSRFMSVTYQRVVVGFRYCWTVSSCWRFWCAFMFPSWERFSDVMTRGILDLTRFILTRHYYEFDGWMGTAKYSEIGHSQWYNCLRSFLYSMYKFEIDTIAAYLLKPFVWSRFIDDMLAMWTHGETAHLQLVAHLRCQSNSRHHRASNSRFNMRQHRPIFLMDVSS